ncbi:MAG: hypothetical protein P8080_09095 [Gammaproteobacteria bacterium]
MPDTTDPEHRDAAPQSRWQRLGWFVLLYVAGLSAMLLLAYVVRLLVPGI